MISKVTHGSLEQIRAYVSTDEGQNAISNFIKWLRGKAGNKEGYKKLCKAADKAKGLAYFGYQGFLLNQLNDFNAFIVNTPPGHDQGHLHCDFLAALALVRDPYVAKARYRSDIIAGILAGGFHDIGNAVVHRYLDTEGKVGHAEVGAWLFFHREKGLIDVELRTLAAYAIAAHTKYLKAVAVKNPIGYERQPYWDELWEEREKPIGLAIQTTRMVDRLENNGVTHFARHLLATADGYESGKGVSISGLDFYLMDAKAMNILLTPEVRPNPVNPRSILEHMATYGVSNFGASPYSLNDSKFPVFTKLMRSKVAQIGKLTEIVTRSEIVSRSINPETYYDELITRALFKDTLRQISQAPRFDKSWQLLKVVWDKLDIYQKIRWVPGLEYVRTEYINWLKELSNVASSDKNTDYQTVVDELVERCI